MKKKYHFQYLIFGFLFIASSLFSQNSSFDLLKKDYPNLCELFRDKLSKQSADYIIAVDVSGSMNKNNSWENVKAGLNTFIKSIPDNDYVSIIAFGSNARILGYQGTINADSRSLFINSLSIHPADLNTDLVAMGYSLMDELYRPGGNRLKYVFLFTDFFDEPSHSSPTYLNRDHHWQVLKRRYESEQRENIVEVIALQLPLGPNVGRDIPRIRDIFTQLDVKEISNSSILNEWFERKRAEIQRDRLRAVIYETLKDEDIALDSNLHISAGNKLYLNSTSFSPIITNQVNISEIFFENTDPSIQVTFNSEKLPILINADKKEVLLGNLDANEKPFFEQNFKVSGKIRIKTQKIFKFPDETRKLDLELFRLFSNNILYNEYTLYISDSYTAGMISRWIYFPAAGIILFFITCALWTGLMPYTTNCKFSIYQSGSLLRDSGRLISIRSYSIGTTGNCNLNIKSEDRWFLNFALKKGFPCRLLIKSGMFVELREGIRARLIYKNKEKLVEANKLAYINKGSLIKINDFEIKFE